MWLVAFGGGVVESVKNGEELLEVFEAGELLLGDVGSRGAHVRASCAKQGDRAIADYCYFRGLFSRPPRCTRRAEQDWDVASL